MLWDGLKLRVICLTPNATVQRSRRICLLLRMDTLLLGIGVASLTPPTTNSSQFEQSGRDQCGTGGRYISERVDDLSRNRWSELLGMGVRSTSEYAGQTSRGCNGDTFIYMEGFIVR